MVQLLRFRDPIILANPDQPAPVAHAIEDLRTYLAHWTGRVPPLRRAWTEAAGAPSAIVIGREPVNAAGTDAPVVDEGSPGPGGIALHGRVGAGGQALLLAAGSDAAGTLQATIEATKAIEIVDGQPAIRMPLDRRERPTFRRRGFYSHTAWIYDHPYALRGWTYDDWRRYVDLLAYLNVNLWMLWVPVGLMPLPFDDADRRVLEMFRDVVAYAREKRGFEVWVIECPNNYLDERVDLPFEQREYWRYYVDYLKNPGDPAEVARILESRAAFYRTVDNADGYAMIDSDPGGFAGSPTSEMVDLFVANRRLLDVHTILGAKAKLVYWTHWGWGTGSRDENWSEAYRGLRERLAEPWETFVGYAEHIKHAKKHGLLGKATAMDYGAVEAEPSSPLTLADTDRLRGAVARALANPDIDSIMGNAQTPLVQLPHIATLLRYAWNASRQAESDAESFRELARLLYPEQTDLIARGWLLLHRGTADEIFAAAGELDDVLANGRLGPPGVIGRFLFPTTDLVARDLASLLRIRGFAERYRERWNAGAAEDELDNTLLEYFRHNLRWQLHHGYRKIMGTYFERPAERYGAGRGTYGSYLVPVAETLQRHRRNLGLSPDDVRRRMAHLKERLAADEEFPRAYVDGVVDDVLPAV